MIISVDDIIPSDLKVPFADLVDELETLKSKNDHMINTLMEKEN